MTKETQQPLRVEIMELRGDIKLLLEKLKNCEGHGGRIDAMERQITLFKGFFLGLTALTALSVIKIIFELF